MWHSNAHLRACASPALAHDDDDIGLLRFLARFHHKAILIVRALGTETGIAGGGHQIPDAGIFRNARQLGLVAGVLVDDAIVEIENIQKRTLAGYTPFRAAMEGADAIGLAVLATTASIVVVFLPTSFMGGMPGQFFIEFGITVAVAVGPGTVTVFVVTEPGAVTVTVGVGDGDGSTHSLARML